MKQEKQARQSRRAFDSSIERSLMEIIGIANWRVFSVNYFSFKEVSFGRIRKSDTPSGREFAFHHYKPTPSSVRRLFSVIGHAVADPVISQNLTVVDVEFQIRKREETWSRYL